MEIDGNINQILKEEIASQYKNWPTGAIENLFT